MYQLIDSEHYISLRSNLLTRLQRNSINQTNVFSWMVWNNSDAGNLYNTETMALGSLGLSAGASFIYEVLSLPYDTTCQFVENRDTWV
jgi:hypothetical protein